MNTKQTAHMKKSTVIKLGSILGFPIVLAMALQKIGEIRMIAFLLAISLVIACPLCILAWKYRAKFFSKKMTAIMAISIPVALFFWKLLSAKSPEVMIVMGFILDFFLIFISFFFEEDYIK